jgi:hypothetical protein
MLVTGTIGLRSVWCDAGRFGLRVIGKMTPLRAELALDTY